MTGRAGRRDEPRSNHDANACRQAWQADSIESTADSTESTFRLWESIAWNGCNQRLVSMDDRHVSFRWKDYAHGGGWRTMTLLAVEFLRRFLLHVLPSG
ncbi:MAG TPA: transposase, partial [Pirellulales bacterium]|nr:transposase [Pirellulales bacterium]